MPHYLLQGTYSSQVWAKLTKNPEDRTEPVRKVLMAAFGAIPHGWVQFEEKKSTMGTSNGKC